MDARPLRPRASENNLPVVHQRHRSTGSLASMVSAAAAGFRGPAKRAAFGDVTNTARSSGGGPADAKTIKSQPASNPVSSNRPAVDSTLNKENAPYGNGKGLSTRPGQRPSLWTNKPKQLSESQLGYTSVKPLQDAAHSQPLQQSSKPNVYPASAIVPQLPHPSSELPPMQPRHYKSQPHLRAKQPSLRRTQSRFLETLDFAPTKLDDMSVEEVEPVDFQTLDIEQASGHTDYLESVDFAAEAESPAALNQRIEPLAATIGHPATVDARPDTSHSYKTTQHTALSEPEEIWDEEEDEDYDDQDQAYMTAHSFRSRDFTTGGATTVLAPRLTARVQRELEAARIEVEQTRAAAEDFEEEAWDVSMVAEYGDEIFDYLRELEIKMLPNPHYMEMQTEIQWSMRSVLMDWLVQVHSRFGLLPETLFLTVNYIDRFLSYKVISVTKLQLVGATALLVASKYEEINCPSMEEIVYMVDNGYSPDEILKAERFMLSMLNFELGWPGPMSFLRRVSKADDYDLDTRTLAKYFLELTVMDERFVATPPSFIAAGAHCLSRLILNKGDWSKPHVHFSGYTWGQLKPLVTMMIECCDHPRLHHSAVYEKYREKRFKEAATIVQHALDDGFTLPHHTAPVRAAKAQPACPRDTLEHLQYVGGLLPPIEG